MASSYELKVEKILKDNKMLYKKEVSINQLHGVSKVPLRFDFQVFLGANNYCFIEVDGEYHFKPIRGKLAFQRQKAYDTKKNAYCLAHNILLLRIPYWDIENLTFYKIFNTEKYIVTNKFHNILIEK